MCLSRVAFCVDVHRMIKQPCVCLCPALLSATLTTLLTVLCNWEEKMEVEKVGRGHWRAHRSALYEWGRGVKCGVMSMIDVDFWHQKVEGEAHAFSLLLLLQPWWWKDKRHKQPFQYRNLGEKMCQQEEYTLTAFCLQWASPFIIVGWQPPKRFIFIFSLIQDKCLIDLLLNNTLALNFKVLFPLTS